MEYYQLKQSRVLNGLQITVDTQPKESQHFIKIVNCTYCTCILLQKQRNLINSVASIQNSPTQTIQEWLDSHVSGNDFCQRTNCESSDRRLEELCGDQIHVNFVAAVQKKDKQRESPDCLRKPPVILSVLNHMTTFFDSVTCKTYNNVGKLVVVTVENQTSPITKENLPSCIHLMYKVQRKQKNKPKSSFPKAHNISSSFYGTQWHEIHPQYWTKFQVWEWLQHLLDTNQLDANCIPFQEFDINGEHLCSMSLQEFTQAAGTAGQLLYSNLQHLKWNGQCGSDMYQSHNVIVKTEQTDHACPYPHALYPTSPSLFVYPSLMVSWKEENYLYDSGYGSTVELLDSKTFCRAQISMMTPSHQSSAQGQASAPSSTAVPMFHGELIPAEQGAAFGASHALCLPLS
ncbi:hypothetical protein IHE44_0014069 [Lamprotornis superbus]|uniref:PNT domain-containing protein n=1 Tax=Lamprotornis superbus TaxID=245042 RepID=A0A835NR08_9PASS|nr:hypothetical protein IHE44_0014069 [Lamprotornis superbus]